MIMSLECLFSGSKFYEILLDNTRHCKTYQRIDGVIQKSPVAKV